MERILFFDGYCTLCNGLVDRLVRWDRKSMLQFASLQGETAKKLLPSERLTDLDPDTVLYWRGGVLYDRSTAILRCLGDLGGLWRLMNVFFVVPKFLRDLAYRAVAKSRYRLFGRRDTCRLPTPEERGRLLS